jgi:hypothetical protein
MLELLALFIKTWLCILLGNILFVIAIIIARNICGNWLTRDIDLGDDMDDVYENMKYGE